MGTVGLLRRSRAGMWAAVGLAAVLAVLVHGLACSHGPLADGRAVDALPAVAVSGQPGSLQGALGVGADCAGADEPGVMPHRCGTGVPDDGVGGAADADAATGAARVAVPGVGGPDHVDGPDAGDAGRDRGRARAHTGVWRI
ncbi:hypothetical protein OG216_36535 [Streptomycetaceae bacterium NBC_01309]